MSFGKPEASASAGGAQRSGQELGSPDESSSVPLGLGFGGLQPKVGKPFRCCFLDMSDYLIWLKDGVIIEYSFLFTI